ncbi:HAD family hydrolase [Desulfovermiculus halophilus]|uniref:HAD family hydrolase n=1 Tax=Desulfovermiculus halophilus TaxID=339722 RepID=UPI00055488CE|nr:HAD family hydrolase [Desulfovermiculus halophilus]
MSTTSLALFDFDGTLTFKDSLSDFIAYAVGRPRMLTGACLLSPVLAAYAIKLLDNGRAKQKVLTHFFAGWRTEELRALGSAYALERLPRILRPQGLERINWHQRQGHEVVVVSASPDIWLRAWTTSMQIDLIGTVLEEKDGRITGRYHGRNCHGKEKARRIGQKYYPAGYSNVYAYGDTPGDRPMLALADQAFYKPFRA